MKPKYPLLKRVFKTSRSYMAFIQLKKINPKGVKDTIIAYDEHDLIVNIDIDKKDKPCGIEIIYYPPKRSNQ